SCLQRHAGRHSPTSPKRSTSVMASDTASQQSVPVCELSSPMPGACRTLQNWPGTPDVFDVIALMRTLVAGEQTPCPSTIEDPAVLDQFAARVRELSPARRR
ncbi:MAG: hypothetical protein KDA60_05905, partial [Planctomycetales bacterium]|nr:hypothetical protein [Planctomycetales bacterium]